jgi:hypothetical protein
MTTSDMGAQVRQPPPGRFWIVKQAWPYLRAAVLSFLPCPDLISRNRMRRTAHKLVSLKTWPGMEATSAETAQLAMMRLLWLQRQTRRAVRGRHREAAAMLARASVEALLLGLYCHRVPEAIAQLHADNIKALGDGLAYVEETGIVPAQVIRDCAARLGKPSRRYLSPWDLVRAVDEANRNQAARSVYRRLYVPLSNFTVHASGGTLLRHVRRDGRLRWRPSRGWDRRSPARVADAATGLLAADLAQQANLPHEKPLAYANKHIDRTLMPMAVMAFTGMGASVRPHRIRENAKVLKEVYAYLWTGPAAADSADVRAAYVRERFASILDFENSDIPEGTMEPFVDYIVEQLARAVPAADIPGSGQNTAMP